jgi:hypothetical protein
MLCEPTESMCNINTLLLFQPIFDRDFTIQYPNTWQKETMLTKHGMGRGTIKSKRDTLCHFDQYSRFNVRPSLYKQYIFMTMEEFHIILDSQILRDFKSDLELYSSNKAIKYGYISFGNFP